MSKFMAVAALSVTMVLANVANAAEKVVLQLHGPAQFQFAGYYVALWRGLYRDAGLEVEIKPGAGRGQQPIDPVREVTEGRAQFGTGTADLIIRTAQGLPLLLLAPIFQQSGAAMYYRADADFPSPAALTKARVGRLPASDILDVELTTALRAEGIDPAKVKSVSLDPGQAVTALSDKSIDAAIGSAWEFPFLAREKGLSLKYFNPADYRVEFYGDTLFSLRRLAKVEPETVRRFREASLKGWEYALQHPDEIVSRMVAELPKPAGIADVPAFDRYQAEIARRLSRYPEVALGHSNPDRWNRIEASMIDAGALFRTADLDDFIYDPDAEARNKTDLRAFLIIGVTLLAGLAVAAWLWLRWQARPGQPASEKGAARRRSEPAPASVPEMPAPGAQGAVPADLNLLLGRLERPIRQRLPRAVSLRLSLFAELWSCRAEAPVIRKVVLDLVTAATTEMRSKGELIVGTRNHVVDDALVAETPGARTGEFVRLTVRDNGPGYSEDRLARILDQAASARPAAAMALESLRPLGGFVRVESAEGIGTAVHLYLPRLDAATTEPAAKPAEAVA